MPLPTKRDHAEIGRRLTAWLATKLPADAAPELVDLAVPEGNGMSSETLLFTVATATATEGERSTHRYVARIRPDMADFPVFPDYDLALQADCLRLVAGHSSVPVPHVPWIELDESPLGAPFFVMARVDGVVPADVPPYTMAGWVHDATPDERARMQANAVATLVALHDIDITGADAAFLDRPQWGEQPLDQHLAFQRWYYDWSRDGVEFPIIERTFAWLEAHRPATERTVLNWGDSRIGNMMWRDFAPVAVLDWEMAALGAPAVDVSWMIFLHRFFQDIATRYGMVGLPDFLRRADVVAAYEAGSGRPLPDVEYYEVFAALRFAIVSLRTSARAIAYGDMAAPDDPEALIMHRHLLAALLDGELD